MRSSVDSLFLFFTLVFMASLELGCTKTNSSITRCIASEREALFKFKQSLVDKSRRLSSWTGEDCCSWEGVSCSSKTGHVLKIDLHNTAFFSQDMFNYDSVYAANYSRSCLGGELIPALLDLKHLAYLDLSMNNFSNAPIPSFLGSLEKLRYLKLSGARFGGNVPHHLGNLTSLQYLDLSDFWTNSLTVDSFLWISKLSSLKHLNISGVHLQETRDWLYAINMLPSLVEVNLSNCLVGSIPSLPYVNLTSLVSLDLQWNVIGSSVPVWLSNISSLMNLRLDGNGFYGTIPDAFRSLTSLSVLGLSSNFFNTSVPIFLFNMSRLSYLDLSKNKFEGTIPTTVNNLCNLQLFDLTDNRFAGEFPNLGTSPFGCLQNLEYLRISYNSFQGPIPASFGTLTSLIELDVSNNQFENEVFPDLGQLSKLQKLDMSRNSLSGTITELHFAKLSQLTELSMSLNSLVFKVSVQWVPPFQLTAIKLDNCVLGPEFPLWLQTQGNVEELRISNASITDKMPDWFERVYSRVHYLDLSRNKITGKIPKFGESNLPFRRLIFRSNNFDGSLAHLPSDVLLFDASDNLLSGSISFRNAANLTLEVLILSYNLLSGEIPMHLCQMKTLIVIDFANNQLTGTLPECLGDLKRLMMLDVTSNILYGAIPSSFGDLTELRSIHLHNNSFEGKLPPLQNLTWLTILDIGRNAFSDTIPAWIGENLVSLQFLSLQSNSFHGSIPSQLCQLVDLQVLNLARNNISGSIPHCFSNFTGMIVHHDKIEYLIVDVDYGASLLDTIKGIERRYTTSLPFLTSLDLSENNIVGHIPDDLTDLSGLLNLNLSANRLNGSIPKKIGDMRELESLDLSRNNLSGPIPPSLSSLPYLGHLNLSYNNLSGKIPTGNQLQTLNDPSTYIGNRELCGAPLSKACPGDEPSINPEHGDVEENDEDDFEFVWFYSGFGPGLLVGCLGFWSLLLFKKSWRYAYFRWIESAYDATAVTIAVQAARLRRKFNSYPFWQ